MNKLLFATLLLALTWTMTGCAPKDSPTIDFLERYPLTQKDHQQIYNDTIAPPNNPLMPAIDDAYTIRGVLTGEKLSPDFGYRPCITVADTVEQDARAYFLFQKNLPIKFDHTDLAGLKIGDTISVTGQVDYRTSSHVIYRYQRKGEWIQVQADCFIFEYQYITH